MTTTLILGGVRSGKSRHAEALLSKAGDVTYVAPGVTTPDEAEAEWERRDKAQLTQRNESWSTVESVDISAVIQQAPGAVLVDCLGAWLTRLLDELGGWDDPVGIEGWLAKARADLQSALNKVDRDVVLISSEVGLGVDPTTPAGRIFRNELGVLNAEVGAACDQVHLVVAGRVLDLSQFPMAGG